MFHGQGTLTYSDGARYQGEYKNDQRSGSGRFFFPNGDMYDGQIKNGMFHGQGTYFYLNGARNVGEWKNDKVWNAKAYNNYGQFLGSYVNGVWRN